jgi:hypothetical protein
VGSGSNQLQVVGYDATGLVVTSATLAVVFTGTNAWPPLRINEWMASNTGLIRDPADNDADDWIELYNPTATNVSLSGWSLTDTFTNTLRYLVPAGYYVPAKGYLMVWADGELLQNTTNRPDLHVDFKLEKNGEEIGLYAPDGTLIDAVEFGPQTNNVSMGRWRDGNPFYCFLSTPSPAGTNSAIPPPLRLLTPRLELTNALLTLQAIPGVTYHLEYKNDLTATSWTQINPPVLATDTNVVLTNSGAPATRRFFRLGMEY